MKNNPEVVTKNIANLVKLTRDSQRPSPAYIADLTEAALQALDTVPAEPLPQGVFTMKTSKWTTRIACAAGLLILFGWVVMQYRHESLTRNPPETATEELVPLPIELPRRMFVSTPVNLSGIPHLEPMREGRRPNFLAPRGVTNVALNKPVTSSAGEPILGHLSMITDGDKEASDQSLVEIDPFSQYVTVDLEAEYEISALLFWHYHSQTRVNYDVVVQISSDPAFIESTTLFNNDIDNSSGLGAGEDMHYLETHEGKLIDARGLPARYVRLHSRGSNASDANHYLEIEVYGRGIPLDGM